MGRCTLAKCLRAFATSPFGAACFRAKAAVSAGCKGSHRACGEGSSTARTGHRIGLDAVVRPFPDSTQENDE